MTGVGSAIADVIYAGIGVFGISLVSDYLIEHQKIMTCCGAVVMFVLGLWYFIRRNQPTNAKPSRSGLWGGAIAALFIALSNPATLLAFFFTFSTLGIAEGLDFWSGLMLLLGVIPGGFIWWVLLSILVVRWKERMTDKFYVGMRLFCGIVLMCFGIGIGIKALVMA